MALELPVVKFSENGEYLAYSDPSGILKVWQTSNNKLHREYVPSSHLSATCTCISWAPSNTNRVSFRKEDLGEFFSESHAKTVHYKNALQKGHFLATKQYACSCKKNDTSKYRKDPSRQIYVVTTRLVHMLGLI